MNPKRYRDWLRQAESDLAWGRDSLRAGHFAQTCFIAQQVAEKCLKSLAYFRGADLVRGHSVLVIARELDINGELERAAMRLDQYYISSRYPDAQPAGAPFEFFTPDQAREALDFARSFVNRVRKETGLEEHEIDE